MSTTDALVPVKSDGTPPVITTRDQYRDALKRWTGAYNVLTPFTDLSSLAPQHGIVVSVVRINSDPVKGGPGEVYDGLPFLGKNEVSLAKIGLRKIADCGGINTETHRTDDRRIPNYWEVKAIATYTGIDGRTVRREATCEWDLRDGSARMKGWTRPQVEENRKNGLRNCEARAINAAIRECGLKQKYTRAELEKPFLVLRVAFQPDMADPEQRRQVTEHALRGTAALYPGRDGGGRGLGDIIDAQPAEPRLVGAGSTAAEGQSLAAGADAPPIEGAVRIEKIEAKEGETRGRKWVRFAVIDSQGVVHTTFDAGLAAAAAKFRDARTWVELADGQDGDFTNLLEILPAGRAPTLPGLDQL